MKIRFGGVRGTDTRTGHEFREFGGDTTSLLLEASGNRQLLIDLGTGARHLQSVLHLERTLPILLTHYHLDHLSGLPVFEPLYKDGMHLECLGPVLGPTCSESAFRLMLASPLWPVPLDALAANIEFKDLPADPAAAPLSFHGFGIQWCRLHHFDGAVAYRITDPETRVSIALATDLEWGASSDTEKRALIDLCSNPGPLDALIFDGHIDPRSAATYRGWGHSSWREAVEVDALVHPDRLFLTHHAPYHDDEHLRLIESDLQSECLHARLARQGQVVEIR